MLDKCKLTRLGAEGDDFQVKAHAWFQEFDSGSKHFSAFDFEKLENREYQIPYWCFERLFSIDSAEEYEEMLEMFDLEPLDKKFREKPATSEDLERVRRN